MFYDSFTLSYMNRKKASFGDFTLKLANKYLVVAK